ncbi:long-chain-fatty-acid--CoA ligase [Aldersonia kunmingensis]|uniref:long-chain-fatty-acid--CoA ligase n=1 Tax=Aldersonia kunmingensis TaxID=408066 RepID=UPI0008379726|nr:long-chain fatty acid--CoA ligase [Aldersonia kunmingensis]
MFNLAVLLEDSARRLPGNDAIVLGAERQSYAELDARANQVANMLTARGVQPGDKVALSCPNVPEFVYAYYGILKAGAVVVPLNIQLRSSEIAYHLDDSDASVYVCYEGTDELPMGEFGHEGFVAAPGCRDMVLITDDKRTRAPYAGVDTLSQAVAGAPSTFDTIPRNPDDTAVILYSSGTTDRPKGAELTHANMVMNAHAANRLFDNRSDRHDTHLVSLPLFHSFGQTINMNAGLSVGATLVLLPRFDAVTALRTFEDEGITFFAGMPTSYWGLLNVLDDTVDIDRIAGTLRKAVSGGTALPVEMLSRFKERFGVQILEGYGLSETSPLAIFADPGREPRPGSIGIPVWGIEARLIDHEWNTVSAVGEVGEIALRGHNVMKGYYNRAAATAEVMRDGWVRTGDLARRDVDGFYYIVDRATDMIVRGGFNVYPREIEEVLLAHPAVSLAAVIGVPDSLYGEEIKAFVVRERETAATEDDLIAWCRALMPSYKYPRDIEFATALPMTASGKILKRELATRAELATTGGGITVSGS